MRADEMNVVTGSFGLTGRYITRRLLDMGKTVKTIISHPDLYNPFGEKVAAEPFNFDNPKALIETLKGASTLYNSYWVRFSYGKSSYSKAVENTKTLIKAAEAAGVRRIIHVSVTNPSYDSPLEYFRGKAELEKFIAEFGLSYAIIRPSLIFGLEDILINNIAWLLRHFPVFPIPGSGSYRLQPIFVGDLADIAVKAGQKEDNVIINAVGPEIFSYFELVRLIREIVRSRSVLIPVPPQLVYLGSKMIGYIVNDVLLTKDEIRGLMANLLVTDSAPAGSTRLGDWLRRNAEIVGTRYASELGRHYR